MNDLRWILLGVGVLFLILLTAWESRRARLARAAARERARAMVDIMPFEQPAGMPTPSSGPQLGELPQQVDEGVELDAQVDVIEVEFSDADSAPPTRVVDLDATDDALPQLQPLEQEDTDERQETFAAAVSPAPTAPTSAAAAPRAPLAPGEVSVEWPPEEQRRIVSVRIVSTGDQRLSGRTTRQALAACGFVHGRYRIFHQPDEHGQALLSCASLNKPGVFDPTSMDYQRYSGLSLFTVLPGPLAAPAAVDHLLHTALDLSERLQARLQDDEGQALDAGRIEELRSRFREFDAMAGPPA